MLPAPLTQSHSDQLMRSIRKADIAALLQELDARSPAGFAIALHIRFTAPTFLFQTYPRRWMDHYTAQGLVVRDPTVRWAMANTGRARWCELEAIDEDGVLEQAKDYGIMNGLAVALWRDGSRSIASFARADRDYEPAEADEIEALFAELHEMTAGCEGPNEADRAALHELSVRLSRP
jgi:LuxR family transcriptional regulator, quorum-sensing system regulator SdiA